MLTVKDEIKFKGFQSVIVCLVILVGIALTLQLIYKLPVKDSVAWFAGIFVFLYIPGNLLLRYTNTQNDKYFTNIIHSVALGTAIIPFVYLFLRKISLPGLALYFGVIILVIWIVHEIYDIKLKEKKIVYSYNDMLYFLTLTVLVMCLLHMTHFSDVRILKEGILMRNSTLTETVYHLGIINVIKDVYLLFN